ncbi:MAG: DUF938 domain-containing protein [Gammaproteobacteria bacterium]
MTLPFSQSCENNKDPILSIVCRHFDKAGNVLEIAGGTGQHAVHFATHLPHLHWQSSDIPGNLDTLRPRITLAALPNLPAPVSFDVTQERFDLAPVDYVFSANSLHIMPAAAVTHFFRHLRALLKPGGTLCVYGPFKYEGRFTTDSNAQFDQWLKQRNPDSGIRDFETINALAQEAGMSLLEDNAMPANNQLLVFRKSGTP